MLHCDFQGAQNCRDPLRSVSDPRGMGGRAKREIQGRAASVSRPGATQVEQRGREMRVNIYAEEMTDKIEIISKTIDGHDFTGLRLYLELPATVNGQQYQGPFLHRPGDDDSSAVTFWGKRDLRTVLHKMLSQLDEHYDGGPARSGAGRARVECPRRHRQRRGPLPRTARRQVERAEEVSPSTLSPAACPRSISSSFSVFDFVFLSL